MDNKALRDRATAIRQNIIRQVYLAGSGHPADRCRLQTFWPFCTLSI